jgi:hypothetical protein
MSRVHKGRWTVRVPVDARDLIYVDARATTGPAFTFAGTWREMVALRTALAEALTMEKKQRRADARASSTGSVKP